MADSSVFSAESSTINPPPSPIIPKPSINFPMSLSTILGGCLKFDVAPEGSSYSYSCTTCGRNFPTMVSLNCHQKVHRPKDPNKPLRKQQMRRRRQHQQKINSDINSSILSSDPLPARNPEAGALHDELRTKRPLNENEMFDLNYPPLAIPSV